MAENDTPKTPCPKCGNADGMKPSRCNPPEYRAWRCEGCGSHWDSRDGGPLQMLSLGTAYEADDGTVCLSGRGGTLTDAAPSDVAGLPKQIMGLDVHYGWKDLIRTGDFRHPVQDFAVPVDTARLSHWVDTFDAMQASGVKVFLPDDHSRKAKDNNGWLIRMKTDGERLLGLMQLVGDEARRKAASNDVSVGIKPMLRDGAGNTFADCIEHVALTPEPVITGQNTIVQAASRAAAAGDMKNVAATDPKPMEVNTMADRSFACSDEQLTSLHKLIPGADKVPDEQMLSRVVEHLTGLASADDADAGGPDKVATLSRQQIADTAKANRTALRSDVSRLTADNTTLRQQVQELSGRVVKDLDGEALSAIRESAETKFENCVARGAITPAVRDRLAELMLGSKDKPNTLALSRAANKHGNKALALAVLDVLADNRPVELGEKSGLQALSHVPAGTEQQTSADKATAMLLSAANKYGPAGK